MKKLYGLMNFEFRYIFKFIVAISLLLIVGQNILLYLAVRNYSPNEYIPFENLISASGVPFVFFACFALLIGICIYSVISNNIGSKSIYTLMTLPQGRIFIYISKILTGFISFLMLIAAQFLSIFSGYLLFSTSITEWVGGELIKNEEPVNALFLAFIRSDYLRILFPMSLESFISTLTVLISIICGLYYAIYSIQSRKFVYLGLVLSNAILIIYVLIYRINVMNGWETQNLFIYSTIFVVLSVFYVWKSIKWINKSSILG